MSKGCEMCNGMGVVFKLDDKDTCPECGGSGIVESVTVPAGKRDAAADLATCDATGDTEWAYEFYSEALPYWLREVERLRGVAEANLAMSADLIAMEGRLKDLRHELTTLKEGTYCAYCGFTVASDADGSVIADHIRTCERHPMRDVEVELARLRTTLASIEEYGTAEINAGIELRHENARLSAEVNALDRLRTWQLDPAGNLSRRWTHEDDWTGPSLELTEFIAEGEDKFVFVYGDGRGGTRKGIVNVGTEDNHATFAKMVEAALARWAELYGEDKP